MKFTKNISLIIFCALAGTCIASPSFGADSSGGLPGYFMAQGLGARALGMGGAYTGVADDASAAYWNPAGLAQIPRWELQGMHSVLYENTKFQSLAAAGRVPYTSDFMFGAAYMRLSSDGFIRRDLNNNPVGEFSNVNQSVILSFAKPLPHGVSLGFSGRLNHTAIDDYSQSAWDGDAGVMWRPFSFSAPSRFMVSAGAVARNLSGAEMKRTDISAAAPRIVSLGGAFGYSFGPSMSAIIAADLDNAAGGINKKRLGVELGFLKDAGFLRGGLDGSDWSFGGGMRSGSFSLNYAMLNRSELGANHNISLSCKFGAIKVLQNRCQTPECRAKYDEVNTKLDTCKSKASGAGQELKDCDEAMGKMEAYLQTHEEESGFFNPLKEKYKKLSVPALGNVLVICKIVSKAHQVEDEWNTDLFDAFTTYIKRDSKNMRAIGKFDCKDEDGLTKIKERNEKFITIAPQLLRQGGGYVVRAKISNATGESKKIEVKIKEIVEGMDFRKSAEQIVVKFDNSGIEK